MKEFTCIVCGEKGIDRSPGGNKMFCSKKCSDAYRSKKKHGYPLGEESCLFNDGVLCADHQCANCGWNPAVERMRKEALLCPKDAG